MRGVLEIRCGNFVIAVGSTDFLSNIGHQVQVGAPGGDKNIIALNRDFQQIQILHHILTGNLGAQQVVDLIDLQQNGLRSRNIVDDIDDTIQHIAALQQFHQLTGSLHSRHSHQRIQILFEFAGGFGTHTQRQRGLTDRSAVKVCRFKNNCGGVVHNLGVLTAHNTGKTDGFVVISDHKHTGLQVADIAIQGGQGFTSLSLAYNNFTGADITVVKCVHGLTVFQHNVVGDIYNVVDRPYAVSAEALPQPLGRRTDFYVCHHTGGIAVTQFGCWHVNIQLVVNRTGIAAVYHRLVVHHRQAECSSRLTGKTDNRVAVGSVIGNFKIDDSIIVADHQIDIITGLAVLVIQNPNTVSVCFGQIVLGKTQLSKGAEHTIGNFTAKLALCNVNTTGQVRVVQRSGHQIPLLHILRAGDDLYRLSLTDINLAYPHMVRVFVTDNGHDLAHYNILDLSVHSLIGFHLLTENSQLFHKISVGNIGQIHKFFVQPFSVQFHCLYLLRIDSGI